LFQRATGVRDWAEIAVALSSLLPSRPQRAAAYTDFVNLARTMMLCVIASTGCALPEPAPDAVAGTNEVRVIAKLAAGVAPASDAELVDRIARVAGVRAEVVSSPSATLRALRLSCSGDDALCTRARERLLAAGLFETIDMDAARRRQEKR
jgi:hypothetical protein